MARNDVRELGMATGLPVVHLDLAPTGRWTVKPESVVLPLTTLGRSTPAHSSQNLPSKAMSPLK